MQQQLQIDDIRQMSAHALGEFFSEREKLHMKSLQQRLEQLVAVHRQLLRKFAVLELENTESKKKIQLRDERINQLENTSRSVSSNMRQQAERHVAELSNLREQIQMLRSEHQKRLDALKNAESSTPSLAYTFSFRHNNEPRSVRGGHANAPIPNPSGAGASAESQKSVRGGRSSTMKSNASAAGTANSAMAIDMLEDDELTDHYGDEGNARRAQQNVAGNRTSARLLFSRLLGQK